MIQPLADASRMLTRERETTSEAGLMSCREAGNAGALPPSPANAVTAR